MTADQIEANVRPQGDAGSVMKLADNSAGLVRTPATRLELLERQVEAGLRDARSLVAVPADMVARAELTFPENAFGEPEPW